MATTYKILLLGTKDGEETAAVAERLAEALFKLPRDRVTALLMKPGVTIKRGLDAKTAARYMAALERAGCDAVFVPDLAAVTPSQVSPKPRPVPAKAPVRTEDLDEDDADDEPPPPKLRPQLSALAREGKNTVVALAALAQHHARRARNRGHANTAGADREFPRSQTTLNKAVSWPLAFGIALAPPVFSWFTLRRGHSTRLRAVSFAWLGCAVLIMGIWGSTVATTFYQEGGKHSAATANSAQVATKTPAASPAGPAPNASSAPAAAIAAAETPAFNRDYLAGKWLCTFRNSEGAKNEMALSFGESGDYQGIVFPGTKIQSHRIGTYQLVGKRIKIQVTRIPELAMTGRSTSVSIGEGIEVASFAAHEMTLVQWEETNPSDRLPMNCSRTTSRNQYSEKRSELPNLTGYVGKHPMSVLNEPTVQRRFRSLLGSSFEALRERIVVASELEIREGWYFGSGLAPHEGGQNMAAFAIHQQSGQIFASILTDGRTITYFGANTEAELPSPLRRWQEGIAGATSTRQAQAAPEIPKAFRGMWGASAKACQGKAVEIAGFPDPGGIVKADGIESYEQWCALKRVKNSASTHFSGEFSCEQEGEKRRVALVLKLGADGRLSGAFQGRGRYVRCR
jgi:hypothetical protein